TQKPFYLVGRLGDQDLSIAAAGGALRVQVGDASQTIPMTKERSDEEPKASRSFVDEEHASPPARQGAGADGACRGATDAAPAAQPRQAPQPSPVALTTEDDDEAQTSGDDWL